MFVDRCDGCLHVLSDYRCSAGSAGHYFISVIIFLKIIIHCVVTIVYSVFV